MSRQTFARLIYYRESTMQPELNLHDPDYPDPIVEEIRAIKHKLAAECDNDISKILEHARKGQKNDGRTYITEPLRRMKRTPIPPLDTASGSPVNQPTE